MLASEIMTTQTADGAEEMLLEEVANLFQDRYVTRLPVVRGRHSLDWWQGGIFCTVHEGVGPLVLAPVFITASLSSRIRCCMPTTRSLPVAPVPCAP